jgi:hypothetical protein
MVKGQGGYIISTFLLAVFDVRMVSTHRNYLLGEVQLVVIDKVVNANEEYPRQPKQAESVVVKIKLI